VRYIYVWVKSRANSVRCLKGGGSGGGGEEEEVVVVVDLKYASVSASLILGSRSCRMLCHWWM
jgi:hypothetical protein